MSAGWRVTAPWQASYPDPIRLAAGEPLRLAIMAAVLLVMALVFHGLTGNFLTPENLYNIAQQTAVVGIVSTAMALVIWFSPLPHQYRLLLVTVLYAPIAAMTPAMMARAPSTVVTAASAGPMPLRRSQAAGGHSTVEMMRPRISGRMMTQNGVSARHTR